MPDPSPELTATLNRPEVSTAAEAEHYQAQIVSSQQALSAHSYAESSHLVTEKIRSLGSWKKIWRWPEKAGIKTIQSGIVEAKRESLLWAVRNNRFSPASTSQAAKALEQFNDPEAREAILARFQANQLRESEKQQELERNSLFRQQIIDQVLTPLVENKALISDIELNRRLGEIVKQNQSEEVVKELFGPQGNQFGDVAEIFATDLRSMADKVRLGYDRNAAGAVENQLSVADYLAEINERIHLIAAQEGADVSLDIRDNAAKFASMVKKHNLESMVEKNRVKLVTAKVLGETLMQPVVAAAIVGLATGAGLRALGWAGRAAAIPSLALGGMVGFGVAAGKKYVEVGQTRVKFQARREMGEEVAVEAVPTKFFGKLMAKLNRLSGHVSEAELEKVQYQQIVTAKSLIEGDGEQLSTAELKRRLSSGDEADLDQLRNQAIDRIANIRTRLNLTGKGLVRFTKNESKPIQISELMMEAHRLELILQEQTDGSGEVAQKIADKQAEYSHIFATDIKSQDQEFQKLRLKAAAKAGAFGGAAGLVGAIVSPKIFGGLMEHFNHPSVVEAADLEAPPPPTPEQTAAWLKDFYQLTDGWKNHELTHDTNAIDTGGILDLGHGNKLIVDATQYVDAAHGFKGVIVDAQGNQLGYPVKLVQDGSLITASPDNLTANAWENMTNGPAVVSHDLDSNISDKVGSLVQAGDNAAFVDHNLTVAYGDMNVPGKNPDQKIVLGMFQNKPEEEQLKIFGKVTQVGGKPVIDVDLAEEANRALAIDPTKRVPLLTEVDNDGWRRDYSIDGSHIILRPPVAYQIKPGDVYRGIQLEVPDSYRHPTVPPTGAVITPPATGGIFPPAGATETATPIASPTSTTTPRPLPSLTPEPSSTSSPTVTSTPGSGIFPAETATPEPIFGRPTETATATVINTATPSPSATVPVPSVTSSPTVGPTETATLGPIFGRPTETATGVPTITNTPIPSITPSPTRTLPTGPGIIETPPPALTPTPSPTGSGIVLPSPDQAKDFIGRVAAGTAIDLLDTAVRTDITLTGTAAAVLASVTGAELVNKIKRLNSARRLRQNEAKLGIIRLDNAEGKPAELQLSNQEINDLRQAFYPVKLAASLFSLTDDSENRHIAEAVTNSLFTEHDNRIEALNGLVSVDPDKPLLVQLKGQDFYKPGLANQLAINYAVTRSKYGVEDLAYLVPYFPQPNQRAEKKVVELVHSLAVNRLTEAQKYAFANAILRYGTPSQQEEIANFLSEWLGNGEKFNFAAQRQAATTVSAAAAAPRSPRSPNAKRQESKTSRPKSEAKPKSASQSRESLQAEIDQLNEQIAEARRNGTSTNGLHQQRFEKSQQLAKLPASASWENLPTGGEEKVFTPREGVSRTRRSLDQIYNQITQNQKLLENQSLNDQAREGLQAKRDELIDELLRTPTRQIDEITRDKISVNSKLGRFWSGGPSLERVENEELYDWLKRLDRELEMTRLKAAAAEAKPDGYFVDLLTDPLDGSPEAYLNILNTIPNDRLDKVLEALGPDQARQVFDTLIAKESREAVHNFASLALISIILETESLLNITDENREYLDEQITSEGSDLFDKNPDVLKMSPTDVYYQMPDSGLRIFPFQLITLNLAANPQQARWANDVLAQRVERNLSDLQDGSLDAAHKFDLATIMIAKGDDDEKKAAYEYLLNLYHQKDRGKESTDSAAAVNADSDVAELGLGDESNNSGPADAEEADQSSKPKNGNLSQGELDELLNALQPGQHTENQDHQSGEEPADDSATEGKETNVTGEPAEDIPAGQDLPAQSDGKTEIAPTENMSGAGRRFLEPFASGREQPVVPPAANPTPEAAEKEPVVESTEPEAEPVSDSRVESIQSQIDDLTRQIDEAQQRGEMSYPKRNLRDQLQKELAEQQAKTNPDDKNEDGSGDDDGADAAGPEEPVEPPPAPPSPPAGEATELPAESLATSAEVPAAEKKPSLASRAGSFLRRPFQKGPPLEQQVATVEAKIAEIDQKIADQQSIQGVTFGYRKQREEEEKKLAKLQRRLSKRPIRPEKESSDDDKGQGGSPPPAGPGPENSPNNSDNSPKPSIEPRELESSGPEVRFPRLEMSPEARRSTTQLAQDYAISPEKLAAGLEAEAARAKLGLESAPARPAKKPGRNRLQKLINPKTVSLLSGAALMMGGAGVAKEVLATPGAEVAKINSSQIYSQTTSQPGPSLTRISRVSAPTPEANTIKTTAEVEASTVSPTPELTTSPEPTVVKTEAILAPEKEIGDQNLFEFLTGDLQRVFVEKRLERFQKDPVFRNAVDERYLKSDYIFFAFMGIDQTRDRMDDFNGQNYGRADVLKLMAFNPKTMKMVSISIPRDTFSPEMMGWNIPEGGPKINNVAMPFDEDRDAMARYVLTDATGLPVDAVIRTGIDLFKGYHQEGLDVEGLIDNMFPDGIEIDVAKAINDTAYPDAFNGTTTVSIPAGKQMMNGDTLTKYSRSRHGNGNNDFEREKRQNQVALAIFKTYLGQVINRMSENNADVLQLDKLVKAIKYQQQAGNLTSDVNLATILESMLKKYSSLSIADRLLLFKNTITTIGAALLDQSTLKAYSPDRANGGEVDYADPKRFPGVENMLRISNSKIPAGLADADNFKEYWAPLRKMATQLVPTE